MLGSSWRHQQKYFQEYIFRLLWSIDERLRYASIQGITCWYFGSIKSNLLLYNDLVALQDLSDPRWSRRPQEQGQIVRQIKRTADLSRHDAKEETQAVITKTVRI
jgi:hypothetical protein